MIYFSHFKMDLHKTLTLYDAKAAIQSEGGINKTDSKGWTLLMRAVKEGSEDIVKYLCENNADLNVQSLDKKETALSLAVKFHMSSSVRVLITSGADINQRDINGWTPLMLAVQHGFEKIVGLLCENNADLDVKRTMFRDTAVSLAAKHNRSSCLNILIESGADINQTDYNGWTPLMHAARNGFEEIVRLLCENKADLNAQSHALNTAITLATEHNKPSCLEALIKTGADVTLKTSSGETALDIASSSQNTKCVQILNKHNITITLWEAVNSGNLDGVKAAITSGAYITHRNYIGWTPLMQAVQNGSEEIIQYLCENNADLDFHSLKHLHVVNALWSAVESGRLDDVKAAITSGADINQRNCIGWTPLMYVVMNGSEDIVKYLCEKNANLNVLSLYSLYSAISLAVALNQPSCLKILIESGADINGTNYNGWTPLMYAARNGFDDIIKLLCKNNADLNIQGPELDTAVTLAAEYNKLSCIKILIGSGAKINHRGSDGCTPLMHAAKNGFKDIVQFLCENHANLNLQNNAYKTAVSLAAEFNRPCCLQILIKSGADVSLKTSFGETALDLSTSKRNGCVYNDCVSILEEHANIALWRAVDSGCLVNVEKAIDSGAHVNQKDSNGWTPLMHGALRGFKEIVELFCRKGANLNVQSFLTKNTAASFATIHNNASCLKILITHGADISLKNYSGETPLDIATKQKHSDCTQVLKDHSLLKAVELRILGGVIAAIGSGADINQTDSSGRTPLMHAVMQGSENIVKILCWNNAKLNLKTTSGETVLDLAMREEKQECVDILKTHITKEIFKAVESGNCEDAKTAIDLGADINQQDHSGMTLLMHAVRNGIIDMVELLAAHNAQIDLRSRTEETTALMESCLKCHSDITRCLISKGANVHLIDANGDSALSHASSSGCLSSVESLVRNGAKIDVQNKTKEKTPLMSASEFGFIKIIRFLILNNADVNLVDHNGEEALSYAASRGYITSAQLLLKYGARINLQNTMDQKTPIMLASMAGHLKMVKLLISEGADILLLDNMGYKASTYAKNNCVKVLGTYLKTLLIEAVCAGDLLEVESLLEAGSDPNKPCSEGNLPLTIGAKKNRHHCLDALLQHGADSNLIDGEGLHALMIASSLGHLKCIRILLKHNVSADLEGSDGTTPLRATLENDHTLCASLLLKHKANPNHTDKVGETPLFHEIKSGKLENIRFLIRHGANIDFVAGVSKISPLMTACSLGRTDIVQYLCMRGAKIQLKDSMEATAFDYAKEAGHKDCMEILTQFENNPSLVHEDYNQAEDSNSG